MEEWIKKSDAIDAIHTYWIKRFEALPVDRDNNYLIDRYLEHNSVLCNLIKSIPSADRPPGNWIDGHGHPTKALFSVYCSRCEAWSEYRSDFCPSCGARMKGAEDDSDNT